MGISRQASSAIWARKQALRARILSRVPPGFEVRFSYPAGIDRSAGGKFEELMSELAELRPLVRSNLGLARNEPQAATPGQGSPGDFRESLLCAFDDEAGAFE